MKKQNGGEVTLKKCPICKEEKLVSEFYRVKSDNNALFYRCKTCHRDDARKRYWNNRGVNLSSSLKYYYKNKEARKEYVKKYIKSKSGKLARYKADVNAFKKYPERKRARAKLRYMIITGRMAKLACEHCGNFLSEAHHHRGYDYPLDVWWLCKKHHIMADKGKLNLYT